MVDCLTYVHDEDPSRVEFLDDPFGRNAHSRHEKGGLLLHAQNNLRVQWTMTQAWGVWTHLDDNVDQLGQLTVLVVVLKPPSASC